MTTCLFFVMAAMATDPQPATPPPQPKPQSELLPAPAEWQFERIDFPLSFAPELRYKGFEELRFAPGMFKPDTETYFTYIFAMKISDDVALDAAALKSMLETYYRGLCDAVAKDKKFDIDVSKISARVQADESGAKPGRHFRATIECYDAFVTGKPLTLNVEMLVVDVDKTDHRIFAAVSPKPADAAVWKQLRTMKEQFQKQFAQEGK